MLAKYFMTICVRFIEADLSLYTPTVIQLLKGMSSLRRGMSMGNDTQLSGEWILFNIINL